jgi:WD40 repeat protein
MFPLSSCRFAGRGLWFLWLVLGPVHLGRCEVPTAADPIPTDKRERLRTDVQGDPLPPGALDRLGTVRLRCEAACVVFSADGKTLVSCGDTGISAWDVATGVKLPWLGERFKAIAACFSQDGKVLITADKFGAIRHFEAGTGKLLKQSAPPQDHRIRVIIIPNPWGGNSQESTQLGDQDFRNENAFFSADGKLLAAKNMGSNGGLWDVNTGKQILHWQYKWGSEFASVALSSDGRILVHSEQDHGAAVVEVSSGKKIGELKALHTASRLKADFARARMEALVGFAFSPDGKFLAAAREDSVYIWDTGTWKVRYEIKDCRGRLAFSSGSKYLVCGDDETIRFYEAANGKEVRRFVHQAGSVQALAFSPNGKILAAAHRQVVSLWDLAQGRRLHHFPGHESPVNCLAFSPDGNALASGDRKEGTLLVWDLAHRKPRYSFTGHYPGVLSVAWSPDGKLIATGDGRIGSDGLDAQIRIWSVTEGRLLRQFPGHLNSVQGLAFSPDGRTLASVGGDARARLWDVATGKKLRQIRIANNSGMSVAFSPDGKALLVADTSGRLALWSTDLGHKLRDLWTAMVEKRTIMPANFLSGGQVVLARELNLARDRPQAHEIRLWESGTGQLLHSLQIPTMNPIYENGVAALSPDGKMLASIDGIFEHSRLFVWDALSGQVLAGPQGQTFDTVACVTFSPDSKILASGSRDGTVLLWSMPGVRLERLWRELVNGRDAAAQALKKRAATPPDAIPFLEKQLQCAAEMEVKTASLIRDLDADDFQVREKASRELERFGSEAAFALSRALEESPSPEVCIRIQALLNKFKPSGESAFSVEPRSALSVAILEEVGTSEARQVLQKLANDPLFSTVASEARAALNRLEKQQQKR